MNIQKILALVHLTKPGMWYIYRSTSSVVTSSTQLNHLQHLFILVWGPLTIYKRFNQAF